MYEEAIVSCVIISMLHHFHITICKCNNLNSMRFIDIIWHKGDLGKIFTGVLYNNYDPPPFLCLKKDQFDESVKLLT